MFDSLLADTSIVPLGAVKVPYVLENLSVSVVGGYRPGLRRTAIFRAATGIGRWPMAVVGGGGGGFLILVQPTADARMTAAAAEITAATADGVRDLLLANAFLELCLFRPGESLPVNPPMAMTAMSEPRMRGQADMERVISAVHPVVVASSSAVHQRFIWPVLDADRQVVQTLVRERSERMVQRPHDANNRQLACRNQRGFASVTSADPIRPG